MKKYRPIYEENKTVYWPMHDAAIAAVVVFSLMIALFLSGAIGIILTSRVLTDRIGIAITFGLSIGIFTFVLHTAQKQMYEKIVFSEKGVEISNDRRKISVSIEWRSVSKVQFHADSWRGGTTYRIWFQPEACAVGYSPKKPFILAVNAVDEAQLRRFVPTDLLEIAWGKTITTPQKKKTE